MPRMGKKPEKGKKAEEGKKKAAIRGLRRAFYGPTCGTMTTLRRRPSLRPKAGLTDDPFLSHCNKHEKQSNVKQQHVRVEGGCGLKGKGFWVDVIRSRPALECFCFPVAVYRDAFTSVGRHGGRDPCRFGRRGSPRGRVG